MVKQISYHHSGLEWTQALREAFNKISMGGKVAGPTTG
jgi:hypothetical protein